MNDTFSKSSGTTSLLPVDHPTHSRNLAYNPALDHIRFLAALLVFSFHFFHAYIGFGTPIFPHIYYGLVTDGYTGVTLFFVLSGFLFMTIALGTDHIDYRNFMTNRFLRIYPLFLFIFFIALSVSRLKFAPADIFYLLFTNLGAPPTSSTVLTGAAWTISIEFTFYMVFPFLARFAKERGPIYLLQAICVMLVMRLAAYAVADAPTDIFHWTLIGRFDQFLIGMLAAQLCSMLAPSHRTARITLCIAAVSIFTLVGLQARYASLLGPDNKQVFWRFGVRLKQRFGLSLLSAIRERTLVYRLSRRDFFSAVANSPIHSI
jgi:peptidoglycan/LPS O-acetylase OafA/YrhL